MTFFLIFIFHLIGFLPLVILHCVEFSNGAASGGWLTLITFYFMMVEAFDAARRSKNMLKIFGTFVPMLMVLNLAIYFAEFGLNFVVEPIPLLTILLYNLVLRLPLSIGFFALYKRWVLPRLIKDTKEHSLYSDDSFDNH